MLNEGRNYLQDCCVFIYSYELVNNLPTCLHSISIYYVFFVVVYAQLEPYNIFDNIAIVFADAGICLFMLLLHRCER